MSAAVKLSVPIAVGRAGIEVAGLIAPGRVSAAMSALADAGAAPPVAKINKEKTNSGFPKAGFACNFNRIRDDHIAAFD